MKYFNARRILPDALVKELQLYVQGGYIYVPIEREKQKRWGEVSGYRQELKRRDQRIKEEYRKGKSLEYLAEQYCLSLSAVRKIIYQKYPEGVSKAVLKCKGPPDIAIIPGIILYLVAYVTHSRLFETPSLYRSAEDTDCFGIMRGMECCFLRL